MTKNILIFSILIFSILGLSRCYDIETNHLLSVTNKSNRAISILYSNEISAQQNQNNVAFFLSDQSLIERDSTREIVRIGRNAWHDYIVEGKDKRLFLYVFEIDTLKKYNKIYTMSELVAQKKYLKLICLSEEELKKINWKILIK